MDHVGVVGDDLEAAVSFFVELSLRRGQSGSVWERAVEEWARQTGVRVLEGNSGGVPLV
jgi:hypothetical protein